jgi:hypothetical protein
MDGACSLPYGLLRVARVRLAPESRLPNERRSPPERLFDRIQFLVRWRGHPRRRPSFLRSGIADAILNLLVTLVLLGIAALGIHWIWTHKAASLEIAMSIAFFGGLFAGVRYLKNKLNSLFPPPFGTKRKSAASAPGAHGNEGERHHHSLDDF